MVLLAAFGAAIQPIRLFGIYNVAPLLLILGYLLELNLVLRLWHHARLSKTEWLFVATVLGSGIWGAFNENPLQSLITDVAEPILFIFVVGVVRSSKVDESEILDGLGREMVYLLTASLIAVVTVLGSGFLGFGAKLSATSMNLSFAGLWFYYSKRAQSGLLGTLLLLAFGGKVGAITALIAPLSFEVVSRLRRLAPAIVVAMVVALMLAIWAPSLDSIERIPIADKLITPAVIDGSLTLERLDQDIFGSRIAEAKSSWTGLNEHGYGVAALSLGGGAGYTYDLMDYHQLRLIRPSHGVHFSPLSLLVIYGLAGVLPIGLFFFHVTRRSIQKLRTTSGISLVWPAFTVGVLVASLTAYSLFATPLFAIATGFTLRHTTSAGRS